MTKTDTTRFEQEFEVVAGFNDAAGNGVTRIVFGPADLDLRAYLRGLLADEGLELREDALGNLFARWLGSRPELPAIAVGSHTDAIPVSGRYDGVVGVLGALEAIRVLRDSGFAPQRSIELIMFTSEEPTRFGLGCLGSRVMSGALGADEVRRLRDTDGRDPETVAASVGFAGQIEDVRLRPGHFEAFVELHIEQGPLLHAQSKTIGVVTAIAAPATLHVTIVGRGGHAGTVLMDERKDALTAGAEIALAVEAAAVSAGSRDTVATVGVFDVQPGAVNSIPSRVALTIDIRDIDLDRRNRVVATIERAIRGTENLRDVQIDIEVVNADPPASCEPRIQSLIANAATELSLTYEPMVSRAYHDALFMTRICPTGMIFVPSRDGISHHPDEFTSFGEIGAGISVLARVLAGLSAR